MLNFNSILIFSENPKELSDFYKKVFEKDLDWEEENYYGFTVGQGWVTIGPHEKVHGENTNPERIMFNFETEDVEGEFERISNLGVKVIAKPYAPDEAQEMKIATFADPENNYFQLMSPMKVNS
ncbi:MAG: VOC family protein [Candidatus Levybacteria bacterium]|nr:VOC family protein [Candidatus Levybacteria bacterium]